MLDERPHVLGPRLEFLDASLLAVMQVLIGSVCNSDSCELVQAFARAMHGTACLA